MSQDFQKVLVLDDRLNCTDSIKYSVNKGAQQMTPAVYNAVSQSVSSHTYSIQTPSEQTVIDRRVLWQSTVILQFTANPAVGLPVMNYGVDSALAPFPLHQLVSTMTATINNNSVSLNMRDVLPALLRFNDRRELARYNGYTPTAYDTLQNYADGVGTNSNVLGAWTNNTDNDLVARGSWVLDWVSSSPTAITPVPVGTGNAITYYAQFTVTEPLLISPFIFANPHSNNQGFYGITNFNFVFNIGSASRVWRTSNPAFQSVNVYSFNDSRLIFNFLTPHPSLLLSSRNIVPYYEMPRYISAQQPAFGAVGSSTAIQTLRTQTIQLNQVPDKLIVFVRKSQSLQTNYDSDFFLTIRKCNINFNNNSGILSAATQQDLYRYSVEAGSNQSWYEFSGRAITPGLGPLAVSGRSVPTVGSLLVLEFGRHIQLVDDFYASGSLGAFNLQVELEVENQTQVAQNSVEIVLITMNSGLFSIERGTSSTYTGILTKQDVLEASGQEPYTHSDVERMVGGSFLDNLMSVAGKLGPKLPGVAKAVLSGIDNPYAKTGASVLGSLGFGRSGAGASGGGRSGAGRSGGARMDKLLDRMA